MFRECYNHDINRRNNAHSFKTPYTSACLFPTYTFPYSANKSFACTFFHSSQSSCILFFGSVDHEKKSTTLKSNTVISANWTPFRRPNSVITRTRKIPLHIRALFTANRVCKLFDTNYLIAKNFRRIDYAIQLTRLTAAPSCSFRVYLRRHE